MRAIDINCDLGESYGHYRLGADEAMMPLITSANIACGFHAGDPSVMAETVALAVCYGVGVGAHPGFNDLRGFGRNRIEQNPSEIVADLIYQMGALQAFARVNGVNLSHLKPHGALYNLAERDTAVATAISDALASFEPDLIVMISATAEAQLAAAQAKGLRVAREAFADRQYNADGSLSSRKLPGAVISDPQVAAERTVRMVCDGVIVALDGSELPVKVDTICIHGDEPTAPAVAAAVREALSAAGCSLRPLVSFLD